MVVKRRPGWKEGDPAPKKVPPAAVTALADYTRKEEQARRAPGADPDQTVKEFLDDYIARYTGRAARSKVQLVKAVAVFLAWCAGADVRKLADVTSAVCHRWVADRAATTAKRSGAPIAHATLKKERALLATAWAEALRREEVPRNPWAAAVLRGKTPKTERKSWSPEQFAKLISACRPWLRDVLLVGVNTGLRIEALRGLEWRDVRWAGVKEKGFGSITVRPELDKTGKGYEVPMSHACHDALARRFVHKEAHATFVLTGMRGRPIRHSNQTHTGIIRACQRAGLEKPSSPNHHMRRTFGRWAVLGHLTGQPIPLFTVSRWMGHSSVQMTETYLSLSFDDSARWMEEYAPHKDQAGENSGDGS